MENFLLHFADLLDEVPEDGISSDTEFKSLAGWDSLVALGLIVMFANTYGKSVDGDAIRGAITINDLYRIANA